MSHSFTITPIGWIRKNNEEIYVDTELIYMDALLGIEGFSHLMVFYWLHENDTAEGRRVLQVHPRANPANPLTGVFATHSPLRPNLVALTVCRLLKVDRNRLYIDQIDARKNSPVIDLKCYIPGEPDPKSVHVPKWV